MLRRLWNNEKGFTLMEIVIVIVILGILALLAIPRLLGFSEQAEIANDKEYAAVVARAAELYWASHDKMITDDGNTPPADASATDDEVGTTGMDGDVTLLVSAGLVDNPSSAIQYNSGTFDVVAVSVSAAGVATVTVTYDGTRSFTFITNGGYTMTGM